MARLRDIQGIKEDTKSFIIDFTQRILRFRLKDGSLIDPFDFPSGELEEMGETGKLFNIRRSKYDIQDTADFIKANGVPGHFICYNHKENNKDVFVVVEGHRRTIAVVRLKEMGIEIKGAKFDIDESKSDAERIFQMVATASGKPLDDLDLSEAVKELKNYQWSDAEIARRLPNRKGTLGVSLMQVNRLHTLSKATEETKEFINNGQVSVSETIDLIKESPTVEEASETIKKAVEDAKSKGKPKATKKNIEAVKNATKTDEELETEKQDEIQYLSEFDWRDLSDSDRKKIMKILVK